MTGQRIHITNAGIGYTATLHVGSHQDPANVILDTGSSTLAVRHSAYKPRHDAAIKATDLAQDIIYRTGGWVGPVITTTLALGGIGLPRGIMAIALDEEPHSFGPADGILGLAYDQLNGCYDLSAYLKRHGAAATYPWPFPARDSMSTVKHLAKLFSAMPKKTLTPFFTQLVDAEKAANKFAFYTRRSVPRATKRAENAGFFILGGGEEQHDLYQGKFLDVEVVHDKHYNTTLKAVQVGHAPPARAHSLPAQFKKLISNSIIDSGTDCLALATDVFKAITSSLDPKLAAIAKRALNSRKGVANAEVDLARWPDITFILEGERGRDVPLVCAPKTYWQLDAGEPGRALFRINPFGQVLSILGLPLLNNYYTVFDRSAHKTGVIRFAKMKP
ncbi:MAG TPA: pepsin-like aspartic protease [Stellaceae bacterium]|nr:pepsin-like aspartic protease [Stellaceae bacterium]